MPRSLWTWNRVKAESTDDEFALRFLVREWNLSCCRRLEEYLMSNPKSTTRLPTKWSAGSSSATWYSIKWSGFFRSSSENVRLSRSSAERQTKTRDKIFVILIIVLSIHDLGSHGRMEKFLFHEFLRAINSSTSPQPSHASNSFSNLHLPLKFKVRGYIHCCVRPSRQYLRHARNGANAKTRQEESQSC